MQQYSDTSSQSVGPNGMKPCIDLLHSAAASFHPHLHLQVPPEEGTNLRETDDKAATTGISWASFSGRPQSEDRDFAIAAAAACHCIDVDETGEFPSDESLGVFELGPSEVPPGGFKITAGQISLLFRQPQLRGGIGEDLRLPGDDDMGDLSHVVNVSLSLGVPREAISARLAAAAGAFAAMTMAVRADPGDLSAAPEESEVRSPGFANDADGSYILHEFALATEWAAGTPTVLLGLTMAYGNDGDWVKVNISVPLMHSESTADAIQIPYGANADGSVRVRGSSSATMMVVKGSFNWVSEAELWTLLDGPAVVADARVFDAHAVDSNTEPLLHATLCKRATGSETAAPRTRPQPPASRMDELRATLTPFETQQPCSRRTSTDIDEFTQALQEKSGCGVEGHLNTNPSTDSVVVVEIGDPEWTRETGRGMDVVLSLPRLLNWQPGQWKERRLKIRRQEEEQERRQAYRRDKSRAEVGSTGSGGRGGGDGGDNVVSRFVKRVMSAVRGRWRNFRKQKNNY